MAQEEVAVACTAVENIVLVLLRHTCVEAVRLVAGPAIVLPRLVTTRGVEDGRVIDLPRVELVVLLPELGVELPYLVDPVGVVIGEVQADRVELTRVELIQVVPLPGVELRIVREVTCVELVQVIPLPGVEHTEALTLILHSEGVVAVRGKLRLPRGIHALRDTEIGEQAVTLRGIRLEDFGTDTRIGAH